MKQKKQGLSKEEIKTLFCNKSTKKLTNPYFSFFYLKTNQKETTKTSFVVSKKEAKSAVKRNKLKRQARYIFNKLKNNTNTGYNCVLLFKKSVFTIPFLQLEEEIQKTLKKTYIL